MNLSHPLVDLLGENTSRVLSRLAAVSEGLPGRQIARVAEVPVASALRVLAQLVGIGLVVSRDVGRARLYQLNREHVLWKPLEAIMASSAIIEHRIVETVDRRAVVATFGSFARNDARPLSDIDLVIVWHDGVVEHERATICDRLHERISGMTGNRLDIVDLTEEDLARMVAAHDPLVDSWVRDSRSLGDGDLKALIERVSQG